jgi:hypothetical protein
VDILPRALDSSLFSDLGAVGVLSDEVVRFRVFSFALSLLATEVELALEEVLVQSNAVPGVFGVLFAEPKDAKAPVPSPKLEVAPPEGDAMPEVFNCELNGLRPPPWALSPPPKRDFVAENTRVDVSRELSLSFVESESLLFLRQSQMSFLIVACGTRRYIP